MAPYFSKSRLRFNWDTQKWPVQTNLVLGTMTSYVKKNERELIKGKKIYEKKEVKKPFTKRRYLDATNADKEILLNSLSQIPAETQSVAQSLCEFSSNFHHKKTMKADGEIAASLRDQYTTDEKKITEGIDHNFMVLAPPRSGIKL